MLNIHSHTHSHSRMDFSYTVHHSATIQRKFAPVVADDDELIQAIDEDAAEQWTLGEQPDGDLAAYWDNVVADVRSDPEWQFAPED